MSDEYQDLGFILDLNTETCIFEGGFICPITCFLDRDGEITLEKEEAEFAIVKVPPDGFCITVDLESLREEGREPPTH